MVHAYVMVETDAGMSETVFDRVREFPFTEDAHVVAGEFDVIAEVGGGEMYDVLHAVSGQIQGLDGVVRTKTYVALD